MISERKEFLVTMLCVVVPVLARGVVTTIGTFRVPSPGAERRWERSDPKRQNERRQKSNSL